MGRIFYIFIWLIMFFADALFFGGRFGRRRRRFGFSFYNTDFEDVSPYSNPNRGLGAYIRCYLRRSRALKKCSDFCSKVKYIITVKNKNTTLVCDTKNKTLSLFDNKEKNKFATVIWADQVDSFADDRDNVFEQTFDNICFAFSEKATYAGILKVLNDNFDEVQEMGTPSNNVPVREKEEESEPIKLSKKGLVDINTASAEEIAELPGINIVLAKRIVKYRDVKGGIKSKRELFDEFDIKEHFRKELRNRIMFTNFEKLDSNYDEINKRILNKEVNKISPSDRDNGDGERIIDF